MSLAVVLPWVYLSFARCCQGEHNELIKVQHNHLIQAERRRRGRGLVLRWAWHHPKISSGSAPAIVVIELLLVMVSLCLDGKCVSMVDGLWIKQISNLEDIGGISWPRIPKTKPLFLTERSTWGKGYRSFSSVRHSMRYHSTYAICWSIGHQLDW